MVGLLVHDWVEKIGGSETVLLQIHNALPDADVLTLWDNHAALLPDKQVHETVLRFAPMTGRKAATLPLMPVVWRHTVANRKDYDWIIASSHSFAHHVRGRPGVPKLVYAHTPARYLWAPELDPRGNSRAARMVGRPLKTIDRARAAEAMSIAVNSHYIQRRVARAWGRDSTVIYPPIRVRLIQSRKSWADSLDAADQAIFEQLPTEYLLGASRFLAYKRLERVISAGEVSECAVVLAGSGPELKRLQSRAAEALVPVVILEKPSDALLFALYERAVAFVFPAVEDFGIMPVEASAAGTPVVVNAVGGAMESVIPGVTGAVVDFNSDTDLGAGVERAMACDPVASRRHASTFSEDHFRGRFASWAASYLDGLL
jgi:glycosyltransferase involved in cell wall biosynthesis